jgi:hypothetical protein
VTRIVGFAHRDGPMRAAVPRKFTLIDAMILIAATAFALVPMRFLHLEDWRWDGESSVAQIVKLGMRADAILCPLALTLGPAVWLLRLRRPRPGITRLFRQPGMAACTATIVNETFFVAMTIISLFISYFAQFVPQRHMFYQVNIMIWLWVFPICLMGITVSAVWIVLWMTGAWRAERSWIDRAGTLLGIYWVASSIIVGSALLAGVE